MSSHRSWQGLDLRCYRRSLSLLIFVLLALPLSATTYYVDCNGNDSNKGTSTSTPWLTIAKVNSHTFSPGDSILFNRGCTWREQLVVPSSGTSGSVITFGAYGSGAKPILNGSSLVTSWIVYSGAIYSASVAWTPNMVFEDGLPLTMETSTGAMVAGSYYATGSTLYVWTADGSNLSEHTMEASHYPAGAAGPNAPNDGLVRIYNQNYITLDGLDLRESNFYGVKVANTSNITIQNASFEYSFHNGISPDEGGGFTASSNFNVLNNTFSYNGITRTRTPGYEGVAINFSGVQTGSISGNVIDHNYGEGIQIGGGSNNITVSNNSITNDAIIGVNLCAGYGYGTDNTNITIHYNYVYNSTFQNYFIASEKPANNNGVNFSYNIGDTCTAAYESNLVLGSTLTGVGVQENVSVYNNTFTGCWTGIRAIGNSGLGNNFKNNILKATGYGWYMTDGSESGYSPDYEDISAPTAIYWLGTTYTLSDFQSAKSKMLHSLSADPKLNANYTLQDGSPAINAGMNLGTPYNMGLNPGSSFPWSTLNQDSQGSRWAVGAFVFLQQIPPAPPTSLSATVK